MIQFLQQKRATLVFILLVSVMVVLMSHDVGNHGGPDLAGDILFKAGTPAVRAGSSVTSFVGDLFRNYVDLRGVRAENRRLADALLRTERERDRLREAAVAGERLQSLLDLKQTLPAQGVAARVAGSGLASGGDTLLLDRGSSDGISSGMPVIAVGGVVGRVTRVSGDLAKVQCITDPASGVAVTMQDSGYQGILFGTDKESCEIHYLPPYAEVSHGDLVVTSGLDQIYPRGIPVGRVVGRPQGEGVSRRFEVKPLVDFQRISEVLVLKVPPPPRAPAGAP
jgi:rod shape-determining protein MreC